MIRKPLTTITINNDPTSNALKHGTKQITAGLKSLRSDRDPFYSRKEMAGSLKKMGKGDRRSFVKASRPGKQRYK